MAKDQEDPTSQDEQDIARERKRFTDLVPNGTDQLESSEGDGE